MHRGEKRLGEFSISKNTVDVDLLDFKLLPEKEIQCCKYQQHPHQRRIECSGAFLNALPKAQLPSPRCFRQAQGNKDNRCVILHTGLGLKKSCCILDPINGM